MGAVIPNVHKIGIFRATALGDLIFALPALEALHETYPEAELVYLGREWHAQFLPGRLAGRHRVIAIPAARGEEQISRGLVVDPDQEAEVLASLRAERFDLALQMHGAGEYSNPFVLGWGARCTVGLKSALAAPLERWAPYVYYQNEVVRALEVAALLGASIPSDRLLPRLPLLEGDRQAAEPFLSRLGRPLAVLHPGSTDPRRCWSPQKYAEVADFLSGAGFHVALTGTAVEAALAGAVQAAARGPLANLCEQLSLAGLVGLLSQADLFIGNDSGPLHLALALGARAVGLFWEEYALNSAPLARSSFTPLIAIRRACPICGKFLDKSEADQPSGACAHAVSFLEEITPLEVIRAVKALLAASQGVQPDKRPGPS